MKRSTAVLVPGLITILTLAVFGYNHTAMSVLSGGVSEWNLWRNRDPGREIDLSDADLKGRNLRSANFEQAILEQANLSEADLSYAKMGFAKLRRPISARPSFIGPSSMIPISPGHP